MFTTLFNRAIELPLIAHIVGLVGSFVGFNWVKAKLDASYAASNHPVDYATGQTAFNGQTIKGYYKTMSDAGTLDVYWTTQFIDFGFISFMFLMGLFFGTFIARFAKQNGWARRIALIAGGAIMLGAISDAIENFISFVMLSNPDNFANWIAYPYSSFAVIKFTLIAFGMFALMAGFITLVVEKVKPKIFKS